MRAGPLALALLLAACGPGPWPGEPDDFFGSIEVAELAIDIPEQSRVSLLDEPREYVPAELEYDGETATVGLRLKGGGSFRALDSGGKPAFKVDFAAVHDEQSFSGVKKLGLNNMVSDPSFLSESMACRAFAEAGSPSIRTRHVALTVDGEPWGLYLAVEHVGRRYLSERFGSDDGNQYEGSLRLVQGERRVADFTEEGIDRFELDTEGEPADRLDLRGFVQELDAATSAAEQTDVMERWLDLDAFLLYVALEVYVIHWDGYVGTPSNFRVYFEPDDQRFRFIPWGCDDALRFRWALEADGFHVNGHHPGRLFALALGNEDTRERYRQRLAAVAEELEAAGLAAQLDLLVEEIEPWVAVGGWQEPDPSRWPDASAEVRSNLVDMPRFVRDELLPGPL